MKIFKRNQLIILVISLMLVTAGYFNFTQNTTNVQTSTIATARDEQSIGDAQLVSAPAINQIEDNSTTNISNNTITEANIENNITEETTETNSNLQDNEYYFEISKLERNTMYSELLETYQEMYNNSNSTNEQKKDSFNKITAINNTKNAIMISENLIIAKGFENVIIFANDNSISVVVKAQELTQEMVAQIQNIISRELKVTADLIHISNK